MAILLSRPAPSFGRGLGSCHEAAGVCCASCRAIASWTIASTQQRQAGLLWSGVHWPGKRSSTVLLSGSQAYFATDHLPMSSGASEGRRVKVDHLPLSSKPACTFVNPAIRLHKIGQALSNRLRFPGVPQHPRPFAAGLGVRYFRIGSAKYHNSKWLRLHLRCIGMKTQCRPGILH